MPADPRWSSVVLAPIPMIKLAGSSNLCSGGDPPRDSVLVSD